MVVYVYIIVISMSIERDRQTERLVTHWSQFLDVMMGLCNNSRCDS